MIQHECRICEELILLDNEAIKLHVRKHWHVIKPKEYFNKYMKDSRMLRNPATEEEETLAIREEEQAASSRCDKMSPLYLTQLHFRLSVFDLP